MLKYGANFLPFQLNGQLNESSKEQHFHLPENYQTFSKHLAIATPLACIHLIKNCNLSS